MCAGGVVFDASVSPLVTTGIVAGVLIALPFIRTIRKGLTEFRKIITELRRSVCEVQKLFDSVKSLRAQQEETASSAPSVPRRRKKDSQSAKPVRSNPGKKKAVASRSP